MEYKGYQFRVQYGGGTMRESQYKKMIDLLEQYKPKRICELGCGQSTLIYEQYCKKYGAELHSIEHDLHYKRENTHIFGLLQFTEFKINEFVYGTCNKYNGFEKWLQTQEPFDFISIDGPPGYGHAQNYQFGRVQLLSFLLLNKISNNCIILIHDTQRKNMQNTLKAFENILKVNFTKQFDNQIDQLTIYKLMSS